MSGHSVKRLDEVTEVRGERGLPGEMYMLGRALDTRTWIRSSGPASASGAR